MLEVEYVTNGTFGTLRVLRNDPSNLRPNPGATKPKQGLRPEQVS